MKTLHTLISITLLNFAISTNASAATYIYNFDESGTSASSFASLSFNDVSDTFSLTLNNTFAAIFGSNAFVGSVTVDYLGKYKGATPGVDTGSVTGGGVSTIGTRSAGGPGGVYDFRYVLGGGNNDRLTSNETVSWKSSSFDISKLGPGAFALHIQGGNASQTLSSTAANWSSVSAVPEPQSYALLMGGLGLIGFMVRHRKSEQS